MAPCAAYSGPGGQEPNDSSMPANSAGFGGLERYVADRAQDSEGGSRDDWLQVESCWVLQPPRGQVSRSVVLFTGGAFAGAAPQLTYRLLIECLAKRGMTVVAVPFSTGFNHMRIADEVNYKFGRCMAALALRPDTTNLQGLPVYGVGHSLGSLVQLLMGSSYAAEARAGNVLMSFNNQAAQNDVPLLTPFMGPAGAVVGPLLQQLATSPARSAVINTLENVRRASPKAVQEFFPIIDQLEPIFSDIANGTQEFTPAPAEISARLRSEYGVTRNLLIQFQNDTIDESPRLQEILQSNSATAPQLAYRVLPGDHTRPLLQTVGELPRELRDAAKQATERGNDVLGRLSGLARGYGFAEAAKSFEDIAANVGNANSVLTSTVASSNAAAAAEMQKLADEIADWTQAIVLPGAPEVLLPPGRY
eukprot:CAMPEP_0206135046 /NCGR_PEP_ID=MMETSP1473-20131121/413_1 /ASSEMBLY_ACC=CAM_ASM_001109 /TAXON_ID=1461547 /ORGANISM="Stichococcus sp, Strain RCC1054" /LENGTH=419 /DNA_ID=CAMNT_0053526751 /DNA_START=196 /DNA_END=1455 /DNA_ORIENTATION=-